MSLFVLNDWIAEGGCGFPSDYRVACVDVWDRKTVALGHSLGRIPFLEFKEGLQNIFRSNVLDRRGGFPRKIFLSLLVTSQVYHPQPVLVKAIDLQDPCECRHINSSCFKCGPHFQPAI
jgi:hypothetical protein